MKRGTHLKLKIVICIFLLILIVLGIIYIFSLKQKDKSDVEYFSPVVSIEGNEEDSEKTFALEMYKKVYNLYSMVATDKGFDVYRDDSDIPVPYTFDRKIYYHILNYNELVDGLFSTEFETQFQKQNSIIERESEYYQIPITGVKNDEYRTTVLKLDTKTDDSVLYIADSYYCDYDLWNSATYSCGGSEYTTIKSDKFKIIKENDKWVVSEFTRPD